MKAFVKRTSALFAAISLMSTSTMAVAAQPTPVQSSWSTLAFLNGGQSAAAYCGATAIAVAGAVAAQGAGTNCILPQLDPVVPVQPQTVVGEPALPPPLPGAAAGVGGVGLSPLVIALGALAAAAAAYFIIKGLDGNNDDNSPA